MLEEDFWLECAVVLRRQAAVALEPAQRDELLDLARVCDTVASKIDARAPSG